MDWNACLEARSTADGSHPCSETYQNLFVRSDGKSWKTYHLLIESKRNQENMSNRELDELQMLIEDETMRFLESSIFNLT